MQNNKLYILLSRNKYGLNGVARKNKVNLEWWKKETNLGDAISPIIVAWMLRRENINIDKNISKTIHLLGVGSLIGNERFDATVWGVASFHMTELWSWIDKENTENMMYVLSEGR